LGVYRGHDEARSFFEEEWFGVFPFDDWEVEVEEAIDRGDQVIVIARQLGRGASSGATTGLEFVQTYSLRAGEIVRVETYLDRQKAMEAAGLSE
jgi:ketosteroid isomerase-like protein